MRVVVDTWNVLHVQGILPPGLSGLGLAGLGRLMLATRWGQAHITLACDGQTQDRPAGVPAAIHVIWSGAGREADDVIEGLIERTSAPGRMVIVSSDNRLRRAAKRRRCKHLGSEQFLRTILDDLAAGPAADPIADTHPSDQDATWEDQFGLTAGEFESIEAEAAAEEFEDLIPSPPSSQPPPAADPPWQARSPADPPPIAFPPSLIEQAMRIARGD